MSDVDPFAFLIFLTLVYDFSMGLELVSRRFADKIQTNGKHPFCSRNGSRLSRQSLSGVFPPGGGGTPL